MSRVPPAFSEMEIKADGHHKVVVLAPANYFQSHERDSRGLPQDWWFFSDRFWNGRPVEKGALSVGLDFVTTEFSGPTCELLTTLVGPDLGELGRRLTWLTSFRIMVIQRVTCRASPGRRPFLKLFGAQFSLIYP